MFIDINKVTEFITKTSPIIIDVLLFLLILIIIWNDYSSSNSLIKKVLHYLKVNLPITFISFYIFYILVLKIGFTSTDWSNLLGSFVGILGAYLVASYQLSEEMKEKETLRKPILYIKSGESGDIYFDSNKHQVSLDDGLSRVKFRDEVYKSDLNNTLLNINLDLINASSMNIYEIDYDWEIVIDHLKNRKLAKKLIQSTSEKNRYNFHNKNPIHRSKLSNNEVLYDVIIRKNNKTKISGNGTITLSGNTLIDESYLEPHESIKICLPSDFLLLIENKIVTRGKLKTAEDFNYPALNIKINFLNYEMKKYFMLFKILVKRVRQTIYKLESGEKMVVYNIKFEAVKEGKPQIVQ